MSKSKQQPVGVSLVAGVIAGAVEGLATYPTDFVKTQAQFASSIPGAKPPGLGSIIQSTIRKKGVLGLYTGCGALIAGNSLKAAVRFLGYDSFKGALQDDQGYISPPRSVLAGLGAGMLEAVVAVTPSETIKTKMVEDSRRPTPRFRGLLHGTSTIVREEGFRGIYKGLSAVVLKQGANSAVRFTTYSSLKGLVQGRDSQAQPLTGAMSFGLGAGAGFVTVYCTMPFDVIKTRMQSMSQRSSDQRFVSCARSILLEDGVRSFWKGTTPRLVRLMLSGGIIFTIYEQVVAIVGV